MRPLSSAYVAGKSRLVLGRRSYGSSGKTAAAALATVPPTAPVAENCSNSRAVLIRPHRHRRTFASTKVAESSSSPSDTSTTPAVKTTDGSIEPASYTPVRFDTSAKIEGEESHVVTIRLREGECVRAESGNMLYMTDGVVMNTTLAGASNAFRRMLTGQNVFLTDFTYDASSRTGGGGGGDGTGTLCLGTDFPSKILRLNLQDTPNGALICQRGAYLASNPTVGT